MATYSREAEARRMNLTIGRHLQSANGNPLKAEEFERDGVNDHMGKHMQSELMWNTAGPEEFSG